MVNKQPQQHQQPGAYTSPSHAPQPPQNQSGVDEKDGPQHVWAARPVMPEHPEVPHEATRFHEDSARKYPELNLSHGEFVISAVRRHPIGLISIWFVSVLIIVLSFVILGVFAANNQAFLEPFGLDGGTGMAFMGVIMLILMALAFVGGLISTYVYMQNKFFLTNESVVQFIQHSLFSRKEQTVSLSNIEDASYRQHGILQHLLNYGNIRLSTQGDETTYRFSYVTNPKHQIALLNNAVEAFKMGRPVPHPDDQ